MGAWKIVFTGNTRGRRIRSKPTRVRIRRKHEKQPRPYIISCDQDTDSHDQEQIGGKLGTRRSNLEIGRDDEEPIVDP